MNANEYQWTALRTMADQETILRRNLHGLDKSGSRQPLDPVKLTQLNNAARGMAGDVGEVNTCIQQALEYGRQLNLVNLKEELGDVLWRIVQACDAVGFTLEEVMQANVAKLLKRYPDKYTDFLADEDNRNREAEFQALKADARDMQTTIPLISGMKVVAPLFQNGQGHAEPVEEVESRDSDCNSYIKNCSKCNKLIHRNNETGLCPDCFGSALFNGVK